MTINKYAVKTQNINLHYFFPAYKVSSTFLNVFLKCLLIFSSQLSCDKHSVKGCVYYFLTNVYCSPNDNPSKTMKNVFYFI